MAQEIMMVPTTDYNNLVNFYKGKITESTLLQKAGRLAAERRLILANKSIPNSTALALTKDSGREIGRLTQRIRSGGVRATGAAGVVVDDDNDDDNAMLNAPLENTLKTILKQTRKQPTATPTGIPPPTVLAPPSPPAKKKKKPSAPSPTPQKKQGGLKEAVKKGIFKSTMKKLGIKKFQTSESEDESDESDDELSVQPKKSRAVEVIKPAPGWEDWGEGKKTRRKLLSEYSEDDDEEEGAAAYPKRRRKKKNK